MKKPELVDAEGDLTIYTKNLLKWWKLYPIYLKTEIITRPSGLFENSNKMWLPYISREFWLDFRKITKPFKCIKTEIVTVSETVLDMSYPFIIPETSVSLKRMENWAYQHKMLIVIHVL